MVNQYLSFFINAIVAFLIFTLIVNIKNGKIDWK